MQRSNATSRFARRRAPARRAGPLSTPRGFTLVEMLVATALVVLIMVMFAEVFSTAVGTLTDQRALGANDQKARTFADTLRGDLLHATFRQPVGTAGSALYEIVPGQFVTVSTGRGLLPLAPGDIVDPRQRGFFYVSENDPFYDGDNVLHFTIDVTETLRSPTVSNPGQSPLTGRALRIGNSFNQPEYDDGVFDANTGSHGTGVSRAAEVCYFLRGGNLYRRVMLLRDPVRNAIPPYPDQPSGVGTAFDAPYGGSLYDDFDYSGTRVLTDASAAGMPESGANQYRFDFNGIGSLDNTVGQSNDPIALPWRRFSFCPLTAFNPQALSGRPREYLFDNSLTPIFNINRFLHEETSHSAFLWPGIEDGDSSVIRRTDLTLSNDGIVQGPGTTLSGTRAGADLLIPNVDAFTVELWDPGFGEYDENGNGTFDPAEDRNGNGIMDRGTWVNLGNNTGRGIFQLSANDNPQYGPLPLLAAAPPMPPNPPMTPFNRVFDTWHPDLRYDWNGDGNVATDPADWHPPYRPLAVQPTDPARVWAWQASMAPPFGVDTVVFPRGNAANSLLGNYALGYRAAGVIDPSFPASTGTKTPEWPLTPGAIVDDGNVRWQCFDNRIGLEKIRVTARYRDPSSGHTRQVTLIHSFVE